MRCNKQTMSSVRGEDTKRKSMPSNDWFPIKSIPYRMTVAMNVGFRFTQFGHSTARLALTGIKARIVSSPLPTAGVRTAASASAAVVEYTSAAACNAAVSGGTTYNFEGIAPGGA